MGEDRNIWELKSDLFGGIGLDSLFYKSLIIHPKDTPFERDAFKDTALKRGFDIVKF